MKEPSIYNYDLLEYQMQYQFYVKVYTVHARCTVHNQIYHNFLRNVFTFDEKNVRISNKAELFVSLLSVTSLYIQFKSLDV